MKCFSIFKTKIVKSMCGDENELPLTLFENVALKAEIFEFLQAQKKIYKCYACDMAAFESIEDLKAHIESGASGKKAAKKKKRGKKNGKNEASTASNMASS